MPAASKATSSSACTAWARCSTSSCSPTTPKRRAGSTLRSAAIAIFWLILCGVSWKTARIPPSCRLPPIPRCRSRRCSSVRRPASATRATRATRRFPCRATFTVRRGAIPPASNSGTKAALDAVLAEIRAAEPPREAAPLVDGVRRAGIERVVISPIDAKAIGRVGEGDGAIATAALAAGQSGFAAWAATALDARAAGLERAGDLLEARRGRLIALLQVEGGKTLDDAVVEVREAIDFCR